MKKVNFIARLQSIYFVLCLTALLYSCGSSDEETSDLNASAGNDANVLVGQQVSLNGNGSSDINGNPFDFDWKFILKPSTSSATLDDNTIATPVFTPDVQGKYKVELKISNTSMEDRDTITISAFTVVNISGNYENLTPGPNVGIRDFAKACGYLIATCEFTEIGGIEANKIARYNGIEWKPLGSGLEDGSIYDMIEFQDDLYVTGQFEEIGGIAANNIARWDCEDETWNEVEGGLTGGDNPFGHALMIYKDELYVGGNFTMAGNVNANNIAKWDGVEWSAVGSLENGSVRSLQVYSQKLYAGGFFDAVNGTPTNGSIASFDGTNWASLGSLDGLENKATGAVKYMAVYDNLLFIGGEFDDDYSELITWNGSQFNDFGRAFSLYQGNLIYELTVINNILYIGGDFNSAVASQTHNLLQWDSEKWGLLDEGTNGQVLSIEEYNDKIYIGGDYDMAGGKVAEKISIWTEN